MRSLCVCLLYNYNVCVCVCVCEKHRPLAWYSKGPGIDAQLCQFGVFVAVVSLSKKLNPVYLAVQWGPGGLKKQPAQL